MTNTGLRQLDRSLASTKEWLGDVREDLHFEQEEDAYQALRAVLHVLRDRLSVEQAADLAAQMPLMISGVYYDGWRPAGKPVKIRSTEEFISMVAENLPESRRQDALRITKGVLRTVGKHVTKGEMDDVKSNMPESLRELFTG